MTFLSAILGYAKRLEREKLVLQLENALLRFEKRLPAPKSGRNAQ